MRVIFTFLFLLQFLFTIAQTSKEEHLNCGTTVSPETMQRFERQLEENKGLFQRQSNEVISAAITAHVIRRSDGSGGLSAQQIIDAVDRTNEFYANANMQFFILGDVKFINSDQYYNFQSVDENEMGNANDVANTINIYFAETVAIEDTEVCGYAYFPGGRDRILMRNSCTTSGYTLEHEIGHFFALYHTHGNSNFGTTDELVDGSNCETAGDLLCDTPADPNLSGNVNSNCEYIGSDVDANGDAFEPDPTNIMSYSLGYCRDKFSPQQYQRMNDTYYSSRTYLISKTVAAAFSVDRNLICSGNQVQFTNNSAGADSYFWEFEGGNPATSTEANPLVQYETAGNFNVRLTAFTSEGEEDFLEETAYIRVSEESVLTSLYDDFGGEDAFFIENPDNGLTWQKISSVASAQSGQVMFMDFYNYDSPGQVDYLLMPGINSTNHKSFGLNFRYAYTYYGDSNQDNVELVYRDECEGGDWTVFWSVPIEELITAEPNQNPFSPSADQWKEVNVNLEIPEGMNSFTVALKATNGYGNNFYLDWFEIVGEGFVISDYEVTNISCFGETNGSIVINTDIEGLTYQLNTGESNSTGIFESLAAGEYTLEITDGSFTQIINFSILEPEELLVSAGIGVANCGPNQSGNISVNVNGGTAPYESSLDGAEFTAELAYSELPSGTYMIEVRDASGCTTMIEVVLEVPEEITAMVTTSDLVCSQGNDGWIEIIASGGLEPYRYQLNGGTVVESGLFEGLSAGTYEVTAIDDYGCAVTEVVEVELPTPLSYQIETVDPFCGDSADGEITFIISGGTSPYRISFNGGDFGTNTTFSELQSGNYNFTILDANDCEFVGQVMLENEFNSPEKPVIQYDQETDRLFISPNDFTIIRWYFNDVLVNSSNRSSIAVIRGGTYTVEVGYSTSCKRLSDPFDHIVSHSADILDYGVSLYPNPVQDNLQLNLQGIDLHEIELIEVLDLSGKQLLSRTNLTQKQISLSGIQSGIYVVKIQLANKTLSKKIIKQ